MELLFAYGAGILTLINPCVIPVLPIVLVSALQASRLGPLALAAGMSVAFVTLGVLVTAFGHLIGLYEETVAQIGALMMIGFGLILLVPQFARGFTTATAGLASRADSGIDTFDRTSVRGQFGTGLLLGVVWSPCVGPTLGGAIALASQGENLVWATFVMLAFALGVSTIILGLSYGAKGALGRNRERMQKLAVIARPILGVTFVVVGTALYFKIHHMIEAWAVQNMPRWLLDLSVAL